MYSDWLQKYIKQLKSCVSTTSKWVLKDNRITVITRAWNKGQKSE